MIRTFSILVFLAALVTVRAADYYAAPSGSDGAAGTLAAPLSLQSAIGASSPATANDTIYLRGGTYLASAGISGNGYFSYLAGTPGSPINVRPYASELPVIEASETNQYCLFVYGSNTWFRGIECRNTASTRAIRNAGIMLRSPGVKLINCVIHDAGVGVYVGEESAGAELYGNLIYNCGDEDTTVGQKHGIYAHSAGSGTVIKDNVVLNGYFFGIHCYSEEPGQLDNFQVIGNIVSESGILGPYRSPNILVGGTYSADAASVAQNMGYFSTGSADNLQLGYDVTENGTASVASNYFGRGTVTVNHWTNLTFRANSIVNPSTSFHYNPSAGTNVYDWDANTYVSSMPFSVDNTDTYSFGAWQSASGFDAASTYTLSAATGSQVFVRTNAYETGRANVAIYNWDLADAVSVDLSSACTAGQTYAIRNAANYFGGIISTFTYAGAPVAFPMTGLTPAAPAGASTPAATGPEFNAFILESAPQARPGLRIGNLNTARIIIR